MVREIGKALFLYIAADVDFAEAVDSGMQVVAANMIFYETHPRRLLPPASADVFVRW